jgi:hypothetical protein
MSNYKNLTTTLKNHSNVNSQIETLNKTLGELRKTRTELETSLLSEIKSLNLQNKKLRIENSHYFLGVSKSTPPLNITLIEELGNKYLGKEVTEKFLVKIKEYRDTNVLKTPSIKRKLIKPPRKGSRSSKKSFKEMKSQSLKKKIQL